MPRKIAERLYIASEIKYTPVKLLLADRSIIKPQGVIENVCVDIREVILPCDFFIIDIEVDDKVLLILGRPFLATGDAWVGVKDKIMIFQVNRKTVILNMDRVMRYPSESKNLESVDVVTQSVMEILDSLV